MAKKAKGEPRWKVAIASAAAGLVAFGGGTGVASIIDSLQGPEVEPQSCVSYWSEIGDLKEEGFSGFALMVDDAEIADRCGTPTEVEEAWPDH